MMKWLQFFVATKISSATKLKLSALEPGRINYLNTGESMEVFRNDNRPAHCLRQLRSAIWKIGCVALLALRLASCWIDSSAGPEARKDLRQAERTFDFWRYQLRGSILEQSCSPRPYGCGSEAHSCRIARSSRRVSGSGLDLSALMLVAMLALTLNSGAWDSPRLQSLYGEAGHDWQASLRQRAKEAAYIRELATEMNVTPTEISGGIESVATDPNAAPIETPVIDDTEAAQTEAPQVAAAPEDIQDTALNGAQVTALMELAQSVATGTLTPEAAKAIAAAAFPLITEDIINRIFDNIKAGGLTPEEVQQSTTSALEQLAIPAKYAHINFKPTAAMAVETKRGLEWREEYNRGGTMVGVARARDLSNRTNLSIDTVKRMNSYFARHEVDKQGEGFTPGEEGYPSAGRIAWALWGGDAGASWASARINQINAVDDDEG
jgi:hypothetical protein